MVGLSVNWPAAPAAPKVSPARPTGATCAPALKSSCAEYALITEDKHHNRSGLVQGGVLMTFADRSCGMTARYVSGKPKLATVQFDTHFVEAGKIGEVLISKPHVVRSTRSLIFITTEVTVDKRCIAMASGVFKILKNES